MVRINGRIAKKYFRTDDAGLEADEVVGIGRTSATVSRGNDVDVEDKGDSESGTSVLHESSFSELRAQADSNSLTCKRFYRAEQGPWWHYDRSQFECCEFQGIVHCERKRFGCRGR